MRYVRYIRYIIDLIELTELIELITWPGYHFLLYGSTGSILDYAYINQLASSNSSLISRNIVLKASVISGQYA